MTNVFKWGLNSPKGSQQCQANDFVQLISQRTIEPQYILREKPGLTSLGEILLTIENIHELFSDCGLQKTELF